MARRNDPDNARKKTSTADQEQEEQVEVETKEPERDRRQDQLGNQAIAAMISASAGSAGGDGGGGAGLAMRQAQETEKEGVDYGGDGDADPVDVNFEEALYAEAWKPRTKKSEQKPEFAEPMPDDDLPPEDPEWMAAVRRAPAPQLRPSTGVAALIQPTPEIVATSLGEWAEGAFTWGASEIVWRALAHAALPAAAGTVDPWGRVLPTRARAGAIGVCALLASPTLDRAGTPATGALMLFDLELRARRRRMASHADAAGDMFEGTLPVAADLFVARAPAHGERRKPVKPPVAAVFVLERTLARLLDFVDPAGMLPVLAEDEEEDPDDDPLGLQAVIEAHTGGKPPPSHRAAAVKAAERLAEQAAHGRVQLGAGAAIVAEVADLWSAGPPRHALLSALSYLDSEVNQVMALLVDIARAAQMGQVGPKGLTRGLSRAAKAIDEQRRGTTRALATAAASALPEGARLVPPQPVPEDPLWEAWADQRPLDALPWLASSLTGWERDAAIALTRLGAGELGLADELAALCPEAPAPFVAPLAILRDAALLYEDRASEVDTRARAERALETRNGLLLAEAAITQMEAQVRLGDLAAAETHRATVGKQLYHLGAYAGFSLLARWSPPDTDDDDPELPA